MENEDESKKNKEPETNSNMPAWAKELKEQNDILSKKVEMFEGLAGKNAIASWKDSKKDNTKKFASFKIWGEKIIVGWGKLDYSRFLSTAKKARDENVFITVKHMDGTDTKINYVDFINIKEFVEAEIVGLESEYYEVEFNREELDKQKIPEDKLKEITRKQRIKINFLNG